MNCFSCDQPAVNACKRCSKTYCDDHGNATYCADCLRPASAMPSFNLYRGSLLVLLVGTAVAVLLLVRPPGSSSGAPDVVVGRLTPTPEGDGGTPATSAPPQSQETDTVPGADTTAAPASTPTPEGDDLSSPTPSFVVTFREYVVQDGDSLFGIAEATIAPGDDLIAYVEAIAALNGWTVDTAELSVGETILLPPLPE